MFIFWMMESLVPKFLSEAQTCGMRTRLSLLSLFTDWIPARKFSPIEPVIIEKIAACRS